MINKPRVTVVMNCHNGGRFLKAAIESVYRQTVSDWEIVFWDNNSEDNSAAISQSFDCRLRYFKSPTLTNLGHARSLALLEAKGEWVAFLDADDEWYPDKLRIQLEALDNNFNVLCYSGVDEVSEGGKLIRRVQPQFFSGNMFEKLLHHFDINMVTPLIHLETLKKLNLNFDKNIYASEEYNLFMRLAAKTSFLALPNILGAYRISGRSLTNTQIHRWAVERFYTLDQVVAENLDFAIKYKSSIAIARARGVYYQARYLMSIGDVKGAREKLLNISSVNPYYRILFFCSHFSWLWRLIHDHRLKRLALGFFNL